MKRFSYKSIYYRDSNKVMRKLPGGLLVMIDNKRDLLVKVYTLSDLPSIQAESNDYQNAILMELKL